jgi:cytochrome P450
MCTQRYKVPGIDMVIEAGTEITIPSYHIHMDPDYYPKPHRFDPDRFSKENRANIPNGAYLPFGDGPRKCIGKINCIHKRCID